MSTCSSAEGFKAWMLAFKTAVSNKTDRRMVILLNQAEYSGLSVYTFVRDAMLEATDFPWTKAAQLIMGEFRAYRCAHELLKNSPYYGYDSSFAAVDASKYRSLGWLSWEILQKAGHHTLDKYSGFRNTTISNEQQLRALVNNWDAARRREDIKPSEATKREVADILAEVRPGVIRGPNAAPAPDPAPIPRIPVVRNPAPAPRNEEPPQAPGNEEPPAAPRNEETPAEPRNEEPPVDEDLNEVPVLPHSYAASLPQAENQATASANSAPPSGTDDDEDNVGDEEERQDREDLSRGDLEDGNDGD